MPKLKEWFKEIIREVIREELKTQQRVEAITAPDPDVRLVPATPPTVTLISFEDMADAAINEALAPQPEKGWNGWN